MLSDLNLDPKDYKFITLEEGTKAVNDVFYKESGGEGNKENLYEYGARAVRHGARQLVKRNKPQEGEIVDEIFQTFRSDKSLDGTKPHDRESIMAPLVPAVLSHRTTYKQALFKIKEGKASQILPAKRKMVIVINGFRPRGQE